ncbi:hypothetical protein AYI69_g2490 [Smittium culicis]|uniref:Uncharacterized protein n=1 Tax=Smittium culicis TaxID=133412 RepID=A0A1R1YMI5_9FUNG|nr:hypothetical protein AYI69_g2490 [Smittium culicis]
MDETICFYTGDKRSKLQLQTKEKSDEDSDNEDESVYLMYSGIENEIHERIIPEPYKCLLAAASIGEELSEDERRKTSALVTKYERCFVISYDEQVGIENSEFKIEVIKDAKPCYSVFRRYSISDKKIIKKEIEAMCHEWNFLEVLECSGIIIIIRSNVLECILSF